MGFCLVVNRPNHGPEVDVEQEASLARGSVTVAHALRIARTLAAVYVRGGVPSSPAGTSCNIQNRLGGLDSSLEQLEARVFETCSLAEQVDLFCAV